MASIDFGSGPRTGDTVPQALLKLQDRLDALPAVTPVVRYTYTQQVPSNSWVINHMLGSRPAAVRVLSPGGVEVDALVSDVSINQLVVSFNSPTTGVVVIL